MAIDSINSISSIQPKKIEKTIDKSAKNNLFDDMLQKSINEIDGNINTTESKLDNVITGSDEDFHNYLISAQKTEVQLQLTLQIRNKFIDAYKEIMRMQI